MLQNYTKTIQMILNNRAKVDEIKGKLEMLYDKKTEGITVVCIDIIRARARQYEHGEKSSK